MRLALVGLLVAAAGCGGSPPTEDVWSMPEAPPEAETPAPEAGERDLERGDLPEAVEPKHGWFWREDASRAIREARREGRGLFVDFYAEWCEACLKLDSETLGDVEVRALLQERFVPLRIDVTEPTKRDRRLLERFDVNKLPTMIALGAAGEQRARFDAFIGPAQLVERLDALGPTAEPAP